jgi:transcriptional regulator with XRE-family HTH domain
MYLIREKSEHVCERRGTQMTLGSKIKKARTEARLTQKEMAEQLSVTFQTVSKWEGDVTEPDLATLRMIAKILNVSLKYLVSDEEEDPETKPAAMESTASAAPTMEKKQIGTCADCNSSIMEGDVFHNVERKSPSGVKETAVVCDACFKRHEEEMERRAKEVEESMAPKPSEKKGGIFHKITDRNDNKPLIWSIILGVLAFVGALVACIINFASVGILWTIVAPILIGYATIATIYCIFTASYISDVFMEVASWSVRFPGLIFTWDLDGIVWLIVMKIIFLVLGALIAIGAFLLAVGLSAFLSVFSFVPLLIYNKTHY